jgi:hypothetical protein
LNLEPLLKADITLAPPQELERGVRGRQRMIPITGGSFRGERLAGRVLAGGADWQTVRDDGVFELDARYVLQTDDGAIIYVVSQGYRHGPRDVIADLAAGKAVDPTLYYMRTTPTFETLNKRYDWLNRTICVATGARRPAAVELEVFEVK